MDAEDAELLLGVNILLLSLLNGESLLDQRRNDASGCGKSLERERERERETERERERELDEKALL